MSESSASRTYLTKSRFKLAVECPAKLMYTGRDEYVDTKKSDEMLQSLAEGGFQIGALAQVIYVDAAAREGIHWEEIKGNQAEQIQRTNELLKQENIILLESTIQVENFLVRIDVLRKQGNDIDLIEVKSKSFDSSINNPLEASKFVPLLQDVAFQTMVLRKAYPEWNIRSFLMMPDKSKTTNTLSLHRLFPVQFKGVGKDRQTFVKLPDRHQILKIDYDFMVALNVDQHVEKILSSPLKTKAPTGSGDGFETLATQWANLYVNRLEVDPPIGSSNCSNCEFYTDMPTDTARSGFHKCWQKKVHNFHQNSSRDQTVLRLYNDTGGKKKKVLMDSGIFFLKEIKREDLVWTPIDGPLTNAQRQWMDITDEWPGGGDFYFDKAGFQAEQQTWSYPYYFLDFEGARCALPFRSGQRPNAMNAFQYSLHMMYEDGRVEHTDQFLNLSQVDDPHSTLLRALKKSLGDKGTIFRWHNYENMLLNELHDELLACKNPKPDRDELVAFIETLTHKKDKNGRFLRKGERDMVDQCGLAAKYYFHPHTRGSSSIKKVLPAIMRSSIFLKETYSQPIYGASGTMPSLNYTDQSVIWWQEDPEAPGTAIDPYQLLPSMLNSSGGNNSELENLVDAEEKLGAEGGAIQNGGAAMMSYVRYQSGMVSVKEEEVMKAGMLIYCELDTLAMVMVMQGFLDFSCGK